VVNQIYVFALLLRGWACKIPDQHIIFEKFLPRWSIVWYALSSTVLHLWISSDFVSAAFCSLGVQGNGYAGKVLGLLLHSLWALTV